MTDLNALSYDALVYRFGTIRCLITAVRKVREYPDDYVMSFDEFKTAYSAGYYTEELIKTTWDEFVAADNLPFEACKLCAMLTFEVQLIHRAIKGNYPIENFQSVF